MSFPWIIKFQAWIPFPIIGLIGIFCAAIYYHYFQKQCKFSSMLFCLASFVLSMFLAILAPVDVFLVSSTKMLDGNFHEWSNNVTLVHMEDSIVFVYYITYGLLLLMIFLILPFLYFYNEESDSGEEKKLEEKILSGAKYSFGSLVVLVILFIVGAVIPQNNQYVPGNSICKQLNYLKQYSHLQNVMEDALVFTINCLGLVGMICAIIYTTVGMSILPINLLKGKPNEAKQKQEMECSIAELQGKIQSLSSLAAEQPPLGSEDRKRLSTYSWQLSELQSRSDTMRHDSYKSSVVRHRIFRVFQIFLGIVLILFSVFLIVCLIISNVNRLVSSYGLHSGYMPNHTVVINPLDSILLLTHKAFPLDYLLICSVSIYFILSSVSGMQHMGIWFLWIQLHRLRYKRTPARSLIFSTLVLACVTVYSEVFIYSLAPRYTTYGTQRYKDSFSEVVLPCSAIAPASQCIMTRLMTFQARLMHRLWFFGVAYFWCSWLFVLIFCISSVISILRTRKTVAEIMVRNNRETSESTENLITA